MRNRGVSHDWQEETPAAKARWFQSLTIEERMTVMCDFADLILSLNPSIVDKGRAQPVPGRIQVLSLPKR